jgi:hypothetical protein
MIAHALGPDVLTQAISLGYFSLGQQRKKKSDSGCDSSPKPVAPIKADNDKPH